MHNNDTPERALALLDHAALMRLDPDPLIAITTNSMTDEPLCVGALGLDAEVYEDIRGVLERGASALGLLGWDRECSVASSRCRIPHDDFRWFQEILCDAAESRRDGQISEAAAQLDRLLDGEALGCVHRSLAEQLRDGSGAICASMRTPKL